MSMTDTIVTTQANPPPPVDWSSKAADEILADVLDVLDLVNAINREILAVYVLDTPHPMSALRREALQAAWHGIRRTRGGMWTVAGRRYRTRALAVEAVTNWYATALTQASEAYRVTGGKP